MANTTVVFTQLDALTGQQRRRLSELGVPFQQLTMREVRLRTVSWPKSNIDIIVLTSKNSARWLANADRIPKSAIYHVGQATGRILQLSGLPNLADPPSNAHALLSLIRKRARPPCHILILKSPNSLSLIEDTLRKDGFDISTLDVYHTQLHENTKIDLPRPHLLYFQAPSAVRDFVALGGTKPDGIAAIGSTTANALAEMEWSYDFMPSRPETSRFIEEVADWLRMEERQ